MKKIHLLLVVAALFGMVTLGSCKPKAAEPAAESTEQVVPEEAETVEEIPAEEAAAEEPAQ